MAILLRQGDIADEKRSPPSSAVSAKKATYQAVQEFERNLKQCENIDFEYVFLSDYHLEFCHGCSSASIREKSIVP